MGPAGVPPPDDRARLRQAAHALEGVFLNQLFQAMRESLRETAGAGSPPGEEMFTSLFDQAVADAAAQKMDHGIGELLYRQLARRLTPEKGTETP